MLVHGDFHGDNHLWDPETLRLRMVIDLESVGTGEPEFDLRCLPGDCGIELFTSTVAHYEKLTGTTLDVDRIMAWHLRTVLGDALWRSEAGIPLPTTAHHRSGWTIWLAASRCSASTPKRHPQLAVNRDFCGQRPDPGPVVVRAAGNR